MAHVLDVAVLTAIGGVVNREQQVRDAPPGVEPWAEQVPDMPGGQLPQQADVRAHDVGRTLLLGAGFWWPQDGPGLSWVRDTAQPPRRGVRFTPVVLARACEGL
jgi:hypothetical protein